VKTVAKDDPGIVPAGHREGGFTPLRVDRAALRLTKDARAIVPMCDAKVVAANRAG